MLNPKRCSVVVLLVFAFSFHASPAPRYELKAKLDSLKQDQNLITEQTKIYKLFDIIWEWQMAVSPEFATYIGYPGRHNLWTDYSFEAIAQVEEDTKLLLKTLSMIDTSKLDEKAQLDHTLILNRFENDVKGTHFKSEYMPINQQSGIHLSIPQLLTIMPAQTERNYQDILARLNGIPLLIDQQITLMEKGLETGITMPKTTLKGVPGQIEKILEKDSLSNQLLSAFQEFPESFPETLQKELQTRAVKSYKNGVEPAYRKLHTFMIETYIPQARESISMSELPEGNAWYDFQIRLSTTTDLSAKEIHDIGLTEVKRIRGEMENLIQETEFEGSFEEFTAFLRTDPQFFFEKPEELIIAYRDIAKRADPELVRLFGRLPRLSYGVIPVPEHEEKTATTAYYNGGSLKAGRPGYFYANTYDLKSRPKWEMEALTLHEAVPGHHLQIALAQEQEEAHDLLKYNFYTAYVEGWGLYSESLGEEMGFYQDPYAKFGQLTYEMWRAIRLVVDTGIHAFGWSRQQAIDFFTENTAKTAHDIAVEVDRYIAWPGQALAYKIGELKIKELRAYAETELGPAFNIRDFHDALLERGALPLNVLEKRIKSWVAQQKNN